jgi:hypothetical protein
MEKRPQKRRGPLLWLAARSRRFWMIASLVVLVSGYPLSFGPAIWLTARGYFRESAVQSFYMPFLMSVGRAESLESAVTWWASLGVPDDKVVTFMFQTDDADFVYQFTAIGVVARDGDDFRPVFPKIPTSRPRAASPRKSTAIEVIRSNRSSGPH